MATTHPFDSTLAHPDRYVHTWQVKFQKPKFQRTTNINQQQRPRRGPELRDERRRRIPSASASARPTPVPRGRPTPHEPDLLLGQLDSAPLRARLNLGQQPPSALTVQVLLSNRVPLWRDVFIRAEHILVRALHGDARFAIRRADDARRRRRRRSRHPARVQPAPLPRRSDVSGGAKFQPSAVCGTGSEFARIQVWPTRSILVVTFMT